MAYASTRDIGFLPGDMAEKMAVFEAPYVGIFDELFPWKNSYENMKKAGKVEFGPDDIVRSGLVKSYIKKKWELCK